MAIDAFRLFTVAFIASMLVTVWIGGYIFTGHSGGLWVCGRVPWRWVGISFACALVTGALFAGMAATAA